MIKSVARFSAFAVFAALLCFAPCAFGQGIVNVKATVAGTSVVNYAPSFFAFAFGPGDRGGDHVRGNNGGGNGCNNQNGGGGGWWGGNNGNNGNNGGGGCVAVPEGGTTLMYLLFAGLACFGAAALRSRRKVAAR